MYNPTMRVFSALAVAIALTFAPTTAHTDDEPRYSRKAFGSWTTKKCQNTRTWVISRTATDQKAYIEYKSDRRCKVRSALLWDVYTESWLGVSLMDVEHIIPLKFAWDRGASRWTRAERKAFANDMTLLVLVNHRYNRQRGDKAYWDWLPPNTNAHCPLLMTFKDGIERYRLTLTRGEVSKLNAAVRKACHRPGVLPAPFTW